MARDASSYISSQLNSPGCRPFVLEVSPPYEPRPEKCVDCGAEFVRRAVKMVRCRECQGKRKLRLQLKCNEARAKARKRA